MAYEQSLMLILICVFRVLSRRIVTVHGGGEQHDVLTLASAIVVCKRNGSPENFFLCFLNEDKINEIPINQL